MDDLRLRSASSRPTVGLRSVSSAIGEVTASWVGADGGWGVLEEEGILGGSGPLEASGVLEAWGVLGAPVLGARVLETQLEH